jgi:hypothetical protein
MKTTLLSTIDKKINKLKSFNIKRRSSFYSKNGKSWRKICCVDRATAINDQAPSTSSSLASSHTFERR